MPADIDTAALRALALAATPVLDEDLMRYDHGGGRLAILRDGTRKLIADFYGDGEDREFYAAANPAVILSLLDQIDALRAERKLAEDRADSWKREAIEIQGYAVKDLARAEAAEAEIAKLRAPYRPADDQDWAYLIDVIPDGGRGRFWKAVIAEVRALTEPQQAGSETGGRGWRPAPTAPLSDDGPNYILVWNGFHVGVGFRWTPNYEGDPEFCDEGGEFITPPVTHWMPRPEPPAPAGSETGANHE